MSGSKWPENRYVIKPENKPRNRWNRTKPAVQEVWRVGSALVLFFTKKPNKNDGLGFQFSFSFFVSPQKAAHAKTSFKVFKHDWNQLKRELNMIQFKKSWKTVI